MSEDTTRLIILAVIALFVIWLIYRIKNRIKLMIRDEIYHNLPSVRDAIKNFEGRINYLNTLVEVLEKKIKELENKAKI